MKIRILPIGKIETEITPLQEDLTHIFPKTTCTIIPETLPTPEDTYNPERRQYNSNRILNKIRNYPSQEETAHKILGMVDIDIYVPNLNFVFGQAECPGKAALISLYRLNPEFYGQPSNPQLFRERITKEAVHELGHTLGLRHCTNPSCVMHFSNSIPQTDRKQSLFCTPCHTKTRKIINHLEE